MSFTTFLNNEKNCHSVVSYWATRTAEKESPPSNVPENLKSSQIRQADGEKNGFVIGPNN